MTTLSPALKRQITEDWHRLFPQMAVYQPMWLARRVGPLVQGICLDRSPGNTSYSPTTHLHNLCRPFPVVSLSLAQRLSSDRSGTQERVAVRFHRQHYEEAARRLAQASLLPLSGALALKQVLNAYRSYRGLNHPDSRYPVMLFEDAILLSAWSGRAEQAATLLTEYLGEMREWPLNVMAASGGTDGWRKRILERLQESEALKAATEAQARELKVNSLPISQLSS